MLDNPDFNNISIESLKQEILQKFMSAFCPFVTSSLTLTYLEVILTFTSLVAVKSWP